MIIGHMAKSSSGVFNDWGLLALVDSGRSTLIPVKRGRPVLGGKDRPPASPAWGPRGGGRAPNTCVLSVSAHQIGIDSGDPSHPKGQNHYRAGIGRTQKLPSQFVSISASNLPSHSVLHQIHQLA